MDYKTEISKGYNGWQAVSEAVLGETDKGTRILKLRTSKTSGGLSASATVCIRSYKDGYKTETSVIFEDFFKSNIALTSVKRITEKAVNKVHDIALLRMDSLINEAKGFYSN